MTVSMVKRVSFVKRDGAASHFPGVGSLGGESRVRDAGVPLSGTVPVPLAKAVTVARAVRLYVASNVLAYIDVVELSNGQVWTVTGRLPDAYPWEPRHVRTSARRDDFGTTIAKRIAFETAIRPLTGVKILR